MFFVFSEFRFDWFEKLVGTYLAGTNASRPETGPIWETGKQASNAQQYLNTIISQKEETQKSKIPLALYPAIKGGLPIPSCGSTEVDFTSDF